MKVGLGLPLDDPESLLTWARRADAGPFSTLGIADRIPYHNPEPLVALAAIAGATSRIRVQTEVLLSRPGRQFCSPSRQRLLTGCPKAQWSPPEVLRGLGGPASRWTHGRKTQVQPGTTVSRPHAQRYPRRTSGGNHLVTTEAGIRYAIKAFGDIGADEVPLYCWSTDPDQVTRFADIIG
jgi:hypothetical protein